MSKAVPSKGPQYNADFTYKAALTAAGSNLMLVPGNLYGFYAENNSDVSAVYLQFFNAPLASVTLGTTVPDFTFRLPAGGALGKDCQDIPLWYFSTACSVFASSTRTGSGAPASSPTAIIWTEGRR